MSTDVPPHVPPSIAVTVDRVPFESDAPPYDDRGYLLVPARAIFAALGADVRVDPATGRILATRGSRVVSMHLGRRDAEVAGRAVRLATAPRLIGTRTLVPLRFVAEAFGGTMRYDARTNTVAIAGASATPSARDPQAVGTAEAYAGVTIGGRHPQAGEVVAIALPAISGDFRTHGGPAVDPDSVRVAIDGVDETGIVQTSGTHFGFTPSRPLAPGDHEVDVNGLDESATPFDVHWTFSVAENAAYEAAPGTTPAGPAGADDGAADTVAFTEGADGGTYGGDGAGSFGIVGPYGPGTGNLVRFAYAAPPGGSGYVSLCGSGPTYPLIYDPGSARYLASVVLPPNLYAPNCYVTGTFTSAGGATVTTPLGAPIPIDTTGAGTAVPSRTSVRAQPRGPRTANEAPASVAPEHPVAPALPVVPVAPALVVRPPVERAVPATLAPEPAVRRAPALSPPPPFVRRAPPPRPTAR